MFKKQSINNIIKDKIKTMIYVHKIGNLFIYI